MSRDTNSKIHFNLIALLYNKGSILYDNGFIITKQYYKHYFKQ